MTVGRSRRELFSNTVWSALDEVLLVVASIVGLLVLIPRLGAEQYGAFVALFALMGPVTALAQSGVPLTVFEHAVRDREPVSAVARSCLSLAVVVSLALVVPAVAAALVLFDDLAVATVLALVVGEVLVHSVWVTSTAIVQVAHSYRAGAGLRAAAHALRTLVVIGLLLVDRVNLAWLAGGLLVTSTARTVAVLAWMHRTGTVELGIGLRLIDRRHVRSAATYATGIGASIVHGDADKVVLEMSGQRAATGVYAAGQRVVALALLPLNALASSSHFAVLHSAAEHRDQRRAALRLSRLGLLYAVPVAGLLVLVAPALVVLLGDEFADSVDALRVLAPMVVVRGLVVFPANGLLALGRNRLRTRLGVVHAVLCVVLCLVLVPTHSWRGAAAATLLTQAALLASTWAALTMCQRQADASAGLVLDGSSPVRPDLQPVIEHLPTGRTR